MNNELKKLELKMKLTQGENCDFYFSDDNSLCAISPNMIKNGKIEIPYGVEFITTDAFVSMIDTDLREIILPDSMKRLSSACFAYLTCLEKISLGNNMEMIGRSAFKGCINLKSIELPSTCKSIGSLCFAECTDIESIYIPDACEYIGDRCFFDCRNLKFVKLPKRFRNYLDLNAFEGCTSLKEIKYE